MEPQEVEPTLVASLREANRHNVTLDFNLKRLTAAFKRLETKLEKTRAQRSKVFDDNCNLADELEQKDATNRRLRAQIKRLTAKLHAIDRDYQDELRDVVHAAEARRMPSKRPRH